MDDLFTLKLINRSGLPELLKNGGSVAYKFVEDKHDYRKEYEHIWRVRITDKQGQIYQLVTPSHKERVFSHAGQVFEFHQQYFSERQSRLVLPLKINEYSPEHYLRKQPSFK